MRKGSHHTLESRKKLSVSHKGKKLNLSEEQRAELSVRMKGNQYAKGWGLSKEQRAKLSVSLRGHPVSEETREKIRRTLMGHRHLTPEGRERKRLKHRAWWATKSKKERALYAARACLGNKTPSKPEIRLRKLLDQMGISYEHSVPFPPFVVDILIPDQNIVIECDGEYWHNTPQHKERDIRKDAMLQSYGYRVIRIDAEKINWMDIPAMKEFIEDAETV